MLKILAVAENEQQAEIIRKLVGNSCECLTAAQAAEKINEISCDLVISAPENISFNKHLPNAVNITESCIKRLMEEFLRRTGGIDETIRGIKEEVSAVFQDAEKAEYTLREIYTKTAVNLFEKNEWLELYLKHEAVDASSTQLEAQLLLLHEEYTALFPQSSDKTEEVILYILNNPESDLKQKTIAQKLYINSSYLSTVFAAQTGMRYVDYLTAVKLKRAAYLIMNTNLAIGEIAERLDYKDIGYFSRLFKSRFGMPPSQYRIPYSYTYEI